MKNSVRIVEFKISESKREEVEQALADLLDEGFQIASQHEADGHLCYTLVRRSYGGSSLVSIVGGGEKTPPGYQVVDGVVQKVIPELEPKTISTVLH